MALPCRISVFTEEGEVKIGMIKPAQMLITLSDNAEIAMIAAEVEAQLVQIINDAASASPPPAETAATGTAATGTETGTETAA
jgi:hypothetical protein